MEQPTEPHLQRDLNLLHATSHNVTNMLGAGPFITIPVLLGEMVGSQAMLSWIVVMIIVMCDGLIWAELGATFPGSGNACLPGRTSSDQSRACDYRDGEQAYEQTLDLQITHSSLCLTTNPEC